ncbi:hypothetical protein [Mucilaginibacter gilvus]|uniref:Uncharacterized protein n=1 Tax=Mucilaginibacter gilvus TaxID=2305909 RepID=A0A3S3Z5U7_9SPHI|nr:hypothetical protein [Mucilaginibacter gilvus]RWY53881.1 hypothetical protein EPL05_07395 [Mucilaginibacter gilvus]
MEKNVIDNLVITEIDYKDEVLPKRVSFNEKFIHLDFVYSLYKIKAIDHIRERRIYSEIKDWDNSKGCGVQYLFEPCDKFSHGLKAKSEETLIKNEPKDDLFKSRAVIINEKWANIVNLQALVVSFNNDLVQCECLIDKEQKIFQTRSFPAVVFESIDHLKKGQPVLISIKSKSGSIRIDVVDGKNFVDLSLFEMNDSWERLETAFKKASIKVFKSENA